MIEPRSHIPIIHTPKPKKEKSRLQRGGYIRKVSHKRSAINREYSRIAKEFLRAHPFCQHWISENDLDESEVIRQNGYYKVEPHHPLKPKFINYRGYSMVPYSSEIHHRKGRIGDLLTDTRWFMACRFGHSVYIHGNPKDAYAKGYMIQR